MYKARYFKVDGKKGRPRELPASLFDGVVNEGVLHQVVKAFRANQRQGTAAAKNRSAVSGGNSKPWRQKGTGRARQGSTRAVQWEGGGRAFPPIPHSWRLDVNRKVKSLARRSAFNVRAEQERVVLIDSLAAEKPKTAQLRSYLRSIELDGAKVLLLTHGVKPNLYLSARNLPNVQVRPFGGEAVYDILWADVVVIEREALDSGDVAADAEEPLEEAPAPKPSGRKKAAGKKAEAEGEEADRA